PLPAQHCTPTSFPTRLSSDLIGRASNGNDVEIEALVPLVRIFARNEGDLAQERAIGIAVTLGSQHLQIRVVQLASRRRLALISGDRKSTRLNSSHQIISYAVF